MDSLSTSSPLVLDQLLDYRARLLEHLERQPAEVAAVLAAFPERQWYRPLNQGGRTIHRIMAHVRDVETLAFLPRLQRILNEEQPELAEFTSHDWPDGTYRPDEPLTNILAGWSQSRAEAVNILPAPSSPAWSRTGFHPPSGKRTLQWWAEHTYRHAHDHRAEFETTVQR